MSKKILKAMENARLVHEGYRPGDHIVNRLVDGLSTSQFCEMVFEAVNPLFSEIGIKYSVKNNKLILTRNHSLPELEFIVAKIFPQSNLLPIIVNTAQNGEKPYSFDNNRSYLTGPGENHTSYQGLANLLSTAAKQASKYSE